MRDLIADAGKGVFKFLTDRIIWLLILSAVLFSLLVGQLFYLQIVISDTFVRNPAITGTKDQIIPAPRGNIYDRFGRPLSINVSTHVVKLDPSAAFSNEALYELTRLFERNEEEFLISFPMTEEWPYEFTLASPAWELHWKRDMTVPEPEDFTAAESFLWLRERWAIDEELSNEDARRILNFRAMLYQNRITLQPFEVAWDVSMETVIAIEEQNTFFEGVNISMVTQREYPQGIYFAHMLGYTGLITAPLLEAWEGQGYTPECIVGRAGLEISMEDRLRGQSGSQTIEINPNTGRRISGVSPEVVLPVPGDNIFLTLDIDMQIETYYILKEHLTEIAIRRIRANDAREGRITHQQIFVNLIRGGWIPIRELMEVEEDSAAYTLRSYVLERFPEATSHHDDHPEIRTFLIEGVNAGRVTPAMFFTAMVDLGILSDYNDFRARAATGRFLPNNLIIEKLQMGELTPQMINIDPSTGSVVVLCVRTGNVLAAVTYPSYDNNRLANRVDPEYYHRINVLDPTHPMINRPFMEGRAPGSTFKMITAVAGLETGVITPTSRIQDRVAFTRAGHPPARCWAARGHGLISVSQAISISCNYFFFETSMRLGSNTTERIETLNRYMEFFGLNERSGVQIGELADSFINLDANFMSSPSRKEFNYLSRNEFAPRSDWAWNDGDTIRTSIGQSVNSYSAAMMARYILQIANRGERLPLTLVNKITSYDGEVCIKQNLSQIIPA